MNERMTWKEIEAKYPDQWLGLTDVEFESNGYTIKSAVVKYTSKSETELSKIQREKGAEITIRYVIPDDVFKFDSTVAERMTWEEIKEKYPDQWVGLADIEYEPESRASIKSAVVRYTNKSKTELTWIQMETKGKFIGRYTTPDNVFQMGTVGYFV